MNNPKTKVKFLYHEENKDLFALFPELKEGVDEYCCYAAVGQHSTCTISYEKECRAASPTEYADLKAELESIGYNLDIV